LKQAELTVTQKAGAILHMMIADTSLKDYVRALHVEMNVCAASDEAFADIMSGTTALSTFIDGYSIEEKFAQSSTTASNIAPADGSSGMMITLPRLVLKL
jgi:hypothetical protein